MLKQLAQSADKAQFEIQLKIQKELQRMKSELAAGNNSVGIRL
jgi:hypothetical protein